MRVSEEEYNVADHMILAESGKVRFTEEERDRFFRFFTIGQISGWIPFGDLRSGLEWFLKTRYIDGEKISNRLVDTIYNNRLHVHLNRHLYMIPDDMYEMIETHIHIDEFRNYVYGVDYGKKSYFEKMRKI